MTKSKPPKSDSLDERITTWPLEAQGDLMQFIIDTEVKHFGAYRLSEEERKAVQQGLDQARRGEFASDEEIEALFARYRRSSKFQRHKK